MGAMTRGFVSERSRIPEFAEPADLFDNIDRLSGGGGTGLRDRGRAVGLPLTYYLPDRLRDTFAMGCGGHGPDLGVVGDSHKEPPIG